MCQYLFAAFTMKRRPDEGLSSAQLDAVSRWRRVVLEVAHQEMLHLALVQNLLASIGAAPHFGRPDLPSPPGRFPGALQIVLIPFSERALRHFLFLERPEGMAMEDAEGFAAVGQARPLVSDDDIVVAPQEFATVSHLYRAIDIGFAWLTAKLGAEMLFIGPPSAQATPASLHWKELVPVVDLDAAHRAIDTIVEQGEGARGEWRQAHFGRFLGVLDEFLAMRADDPAFEPARPVLPGRVRRAGHANVPLISDRTSARVADLFNAANEVMLLALARHFAHTDETAEELKMLAHIAVSLMFAAIKPLGDLLTTLPFGPEQPGRTAGPTFEMSYRGGYLLPHREAAWLVMAERLRQAAEFGRLIETGSDVRLGSVIGALDEYAGLLESPRTTFA